MERVRNAAIIIGAALVGEALLIAWLVSRRRKRKRLAGALAGQPVTGDPVVDADDDTMLVSIGAAYRIDDDWERNDDDGEAGGHKT
jgi:hypothetical protein